MEFINGVKSYVNPPKLYMVFVEGISHNKTTEVLCTSVVDVTLP